MGAGGASSNTIRLKGAANFVRHNPRTDKFVVKRFHSLEFWCSDATTTYKRFQHALGMTLVAKSDLSTTNPLFASYVVQSNDLVFAFTAPYSRTAWQYAAEPKAPLPHFNQQQAHDFIMAHGLAVRAVGIEVEDADQAFHTSVENGAIPVLAPQVLTDEVTGKSSTIAEVKLYGDVVLRYISGDFDGPYLPNYQRLLDEPRICYGITRLDHAVGNVPNLLEVLNYIVSFTGFHEFAEFTAEDVGTVDSGLNSMVLASNNELVLLPVNEPTHGTPRKSQIQTYLEQNEGPGLQHLALKTNDIFRTLREMQSRSAYGGFEFMPRPSAKYYKELPNKIGDALTPEQYKLCEEMGILADKDDQGVLLQIFTKPLGDRPTIFIEIIERVGCLREKVATPAATAATADATDVATAATAANGEGAPEPTHMGRPVRAVQGLEVDWERYKQRDPAAASVPAVQGGAIQGGAAGVGSVGGVGSVEAAALALEQVPGCGGFGKGNFSELFKRIEDYERTLSIQK